jgi:hypothetical protein
VEEGQEEEEQKAVKKPLSVEKCSAEYAVLW